MRYRDLAECENEVATRFNKFTKAPTTKAYFTVKNKKNKKSVVSNGTSKSTSSFNKYQFQS